MKEAKSHKASKKKHKDEKQTRKHKKHKKRDRRSSPSSDSSSGSSDGGRVRGTALSQLERERAAVQAARYLLSTQPAVRKSFRELLWELDNGRAVGLAGVPDALLRSQLQHTLALLGLKLTKGQYWLPSGAPTTLSIIGFVFDEPARPAAAPPAGMPATPPAAAAAAAAGPPGLGQAAAAPVGPADASEPQQLPGNSQHQEVQQQGQQQQQQQQEKQELHAAEAPGIGPAGPPGMVGPHAPAAAPGNHSSGKDEQRQVEQQQDDPGASDEQAAKPKRRVMGPAAPPAALLAAAAAYHAEMDAAGGYEQELEPLVGPPPPDFVDEADAASADAREAQVVRVLRVLREAAAAAGGPAFAAAAAGVPSMDPYAVLGVEATADSASIRKSYWRLSLLVHPDKCSHPAAQEVFQAVSKAAQLLQDAQQRAAHDAAQADVALRQQAAAAAAAAEREVAWRRARGEAVPAKLAAALAAAQAAQPAARDTWMTHLPTQQDRSAASVLAAGLSQVSQTSFNRFGSKKPGDSSGWTDTPQQAAQRAAGLLPAAGPAVYALTGPSLTGAAAEGAPVAAELLAAMDKYNQRHRHQSLLEQHAEQGQPGRKKERGSKLKEKESQRQGEKKESREKSKDKSSRKEKQQDSKGEKRKPSGEPEGESWQGKHPWQPWDRDKDLEVQMQRPKAAGDLLKAAGNLSSRFSSGGR